MIKIATRMAPDYVQRSLHLVLTDDTIHFRHGASITSKKNENAMHKEIKSQQWKAEEEKVLKYWEPVEPRPEWFLLPKHAGGYGGLVKKEGRRRHSATKGR